MADEKEIASGTFPQPDIAGAEFQGFARSLAQVSTLLMLLAVSYLYFGEEIRFERDIYVGLILVFAAAIFLLRVVPAFKRRPRLQLILETIVMTVFVTAIATLTGGIESPLLNLYLLPLIVAALVLGKTLTITMLLAVFLCHAGFVYWPQAAATPEPVKIVGVFFSFMPIVMITILTTLLSENIRTTRELIMSVADRDDLTDLYNMRAFTRRLDAVHLSATRHQQPYAIVMIDLDNLKPINDEYGLEAGNRAIQLVGNAILRCIRSSDIAARYGGDEFIVLLPNSNIDESEQAIRRIRNTIYSTTLKAARKKMVRITVSVGLATYPKHGSDPGQLLAKADRAMYEDKALRRTHAKQSNDVFENLNAK